MNPMSEMKYTIVHTVEVDNIFHPDKSNRAVVAVRDDEQYESHILKYMICAGYRHLEQSYSR